MAYNSFGNKCVLFVIMLTLLAPIRGLSELEADLKKVQLALREHSLETVLNIKVSVTMIEVFAEDAKERLVADLKSAAQGFWKTIKMLQSAAAEDVSGCIKVATKNLKELDDTAVFGAHHKVENILLEAQEEATEAISESRSYLSEIPVLAEQIQNCNELKGFCKIILHDRMVELLTDSWKTIEEAWEDILAYRKKTITILKELELNPDAYLEAYMPIIRNVTTCILNNK